MRDDNYDDVTHVLFNCPPVRNVWRSSNLWNEVNVVLQQNNTLHDIGFYFLQEFPQVKGE